MKTTMPPDSPLLKSGLAQAKALAELPPDADFAFIGVMDGDGIRVGLATRIGSKWTLQADLGIKRGIETAGVFVTGKW